MDAHQRRGRVDVAHDQCDQTLDMLAFAGTVLAAWARVGQLAFEAENAEVSPARGEIRFGDLADTDVSHTFIVLCSRLPGLFFGSLRFCRRCPMTMRCDRVMG